MFDRAPRARARAYRGAKPLAKIRADGELTRKFDNPAIRRLALKRLGVRAISKKQIGSVFGDMPGNTFRSGGGCGAAGPPVSLMAFAFSRSRLPGCTASARRKTSHA